MEGRGIDGIQPVPCPPPRPRQHGNPAICAPGPRAGQVWAQYWGWYLNRLCSQSCLEPLFTTNARSSSRVLTCSQSHFWAEILSAAHHLSLDGASTSTPSYLMLARSSEDLRSHIWYNWPDRHWAHIGCQLWEHRMVAWHRDDTGGTGGVASHQSRVTIIWKSNPISEPTRNMAVAASHWQTTHGNLSFSPTFEAAFLDMVLDLTGTQTHHLSFLFKRNNGLRCWSARILVLVCIII